MMTRRNAATVEVVALSVWLGAAGLFAAAVAPAAFAVLPTRTLAGALVGRVLPTIFYAGMLVGLVALLAERTAAAHGPGARTVPGLIIVCCCAVAQFLIAPRIDRLRQSIAGPVDDLALGDPRRAAFGQLHGASVALLGVAMIAAVGAVLLATRSLQPRHSA